MTDDARIQDVDKIVERAAEAARAFRGLDHQQVDKIGGAMVRAGVRAAPELAVNAFMDLSNRTNPRMPMVEEITGLLRAGYYGADSHAH